MPEEYETVFADRLKPGDQCARMQGQQRFEVLRPLETTEDLFGREMIRYWCRALDDDREGWVTYGRAGIVFRRKS